MYLPAGTLLPGGPTLREKVPQAHKVALVDLPMGVEVMIAGHDEGRTLVDESWATLSLELPEVAPPARFNRIDLKIDRTWQPALYLAGSADMRAVGVQVGTIQLLR